MGENKESGPAAAAESANPQQPDADATSSETLEDVEAAAKVSTGSGLASESSRLETSSPEPEGSGGERADGSDAGGPM
jgi:hypothetical protein